MSVEAGWVWWCLLKKVEILAFLTAGSEGRTPLFVLFCDSELMSGSCHLDRASNVEIGVECQIFVIVIFINCDRVLQFGAHNSKEIIFSALYYFQIWFSCGLKISKQTFNTKFVIRCCALLKWHEPHISNKHLISLFEFCPCFKQPSILKILSVLIFSPKKEWSK